MWSFQPVRIFNSLSLGQPSHHALVSWTQAEKAEAESIAVEEAEAEKVAAEQLAMEQAAAASN